MLCEYKYIKFYYPIMQMTLIKGLLVKFFNLIYQSLLANFNLRVMKS